MQMVVLKPGEDVEDAIRAAQGKAGALDGGTARDGASSAAAGGENLPSGDTSGAGSSGGVG